MKSVPKKIEIDHVVKKEREKERKINQSLCGERIE
jgi:hypothetical protein